MQFCTTKMFGQFKRYSIEKNDASYIGPNNPQYPNNFKYSTVTRKDKRILDLGKINISMGESNA